MSEPRTAATTATGERLIIANWHAFDLTRDVLAIEAEAAKLERERLRDLLGAAIERNHGQRGHPQPFIDCQREICKWGWDVPADIFADKP